MLTPVEKRQIQNSNSEGNKKQNTPPSAATTKTPSAHTKTRGSRVATFTRLPGGSLCRLRCGSCPGWPSKPHPSSDLLLCPVPSSPTAISSDGCITLHTRQDSPLSSPYFMKPPLIVFLFAEQHHKQAPLSLWDAKAQFLLCCRVGQGTELCGQPGINFHFILTSLP